MLGRCVFVRRRQFLIKCQFLVGNEMATRSGQKNLKNHFNKEEKRQHKDGHVNDGLIDIDSLECAVVIINCVASAQAHKENKDENKSPQPVMLNHVDNTSAKAWTRKAAKHSKGAKALNRILARLLMNQNLGINAQFIEGKKNVLADRISRVHKINSFLDFKILKQEFPQLESSRRFHPAPKLLSEIFQALCMGKAGDTMSKAMTGHFEQGKNSLQNSVKTFT